MAVTPVAARGDMELARDGAPIAAIVDGSTPDLARSAATELQVHIARMSGAELPIVTQRVPGQPTIFVGGDPAFERLGTTSDALGLGDEGFIIRSVEDDLVLAGGSHLATLYAVYDLLEDDLGCHWFWPGEIGEVVPERSTIVLPALDRVERPSFAIRWIGSGDFALRNRMNVQTNEPDDFQVKWFVHTWLRLVPPADHADAHPEYYAEIGGKRADPRGDRLVNLCTSNPEVAAVAARTIDDLMQIEPGIDMISVDPEDTQEFCQCAKCVALYGDATLAFEQRESLRVFDFTNRVAELVADDYPDLTIKTIAYHTYVRPPADPDWRPADNVAVQFCRFMCHNHALDDATCPDNRGFDAWYREWLGRTSRVMFYEYYWKVSWVGLPWPINRMLRADMPRFQRDALLGIATQFNTNYATNGLGYWFAAKLAWNADADMDELVATYYREFFAEAEAPVAAYYERLDRAAETTGVHIAGQRPYADILKLFTPELLDDLEAHLAEAADLAKSGQVRERVAMLTSGVTYARMVREYVAAVRDSGEVDPDHPWTAMHPENTQRAKDVGEPLAQAIRDYLALPENGPSLDQPNGYTEILLNPANVVGFLAGGAEGEVTLTKRQWLEREGNEVKVGEMPETFSIWVYGNDLDFVNATPEHALAMRGPDGEWEVVGHVGNTTPIGDGTSMCFVASGIDAKRYLREPKLELRFTNEPEGPYASRVFALYIMPDAPDTPPEEATTRVDEDLTTVRAESAGFTEYGYRGFMSLESAEWIVPLEFVGFGE